MMAKVVIAPIASWPNFVQLLPPGGKPHDIMGMQTKRVISTASDFGGRLATASCGCRHAGVLESRRVCACVSYSARWLGTGRIRLRQAGGTVCRFPDACV
ncbi:unnamed protein product [Protopolystoma xenopodis]|uniref:Uncharacterized protein n=1 Tax=Protopolystoma xenopodis TaxID=117903 RepID=A0A448X6H6_9PLAT|nr:unnamed protein product [Protopolystoma xenopodis]